MNKHKKCCKCLKAKEIAEFWKNAKALDGLQPRCKDCHRFVTDKNKSKSNKLLIKYGITLDQYKELAAFNDNVCSICCQPETIIDPRSKLVRSLAVDHDHKLGIIRGLLCSKCNRGIGMFDAMPEKLSAAVNYLNAYKEALGEVHAANARKI